MNTPDENFPCDHLDASLGFYGKLAGAIAGLKVRLQAQYERRFPGQAAKIRNAIEEAESVAWCTAFPHLFLPDIAEARVVAYVGRF